MSRMLNCLALSFKESWHLGADAIDRDAEAKDLTAQAITSPIAITSFLKNSEVSASELVLDRTLQN